METDKLKHFFYANVISFFLINSLRNVVNLHIIFGGLVVLFLLFEVYQKVFKKGQFDWMDWIWGVAGALTIYLTAYI